MNDRTASIRLDGATALRPVTIIGSDRGTTCGVTDYSHRLVEALERAAPGAVRLEMLETDSPRGFVGAIVERLARDEIVHMQLPIDGWGNSLLPGSALALARLATRRGRIVLTQHEWISLHPLRYLATVPDLLVADAFVFVSQTQAASFMRSPVVPRARRDAARTIPLGPNIMPGPLDAGAIAAERARIEAAAAGGCELVVGYFGALYSAKHSSKQPMRLLDALAALRARGVNARLVVCGDFLSDKKAEAEAFHAHAAALGVADALDHRGRIEDHVELMTTLSACDVFLLPYVDGVSARRSTFQAVAQLARPVVTTRPERADEFARHPRLAEKIADASTVLVEPSASPEEIAQALLAAHGARESAFAVDLAALWDEAAREHLSLYEALSRTSGAHRA